LDETLIHFQETKVGGQFFLRPFAQDFIEQMSPHFELVIFTAAIKEYADWILDRLDPGRLITHRLYRCSTT
jgi:CTD small phosphatase-like protein 2